MGVSKNAFDYDELALASRPARAGYDYIGNGREHLITDEAFTLALDEINQQLTGRPSPYHQHLPSTYMWSE